MPTNTPRDSKGKFTTVKETVEEAANIFSLIYRLLPVFLVLFGIFNYFKIWGPIKNYAYFLANLGNPDCNLVCGVSDGL